LDVIRFAADETSLEDRLVMLGMIVLGRKFGHRGVGWAAGDGVLEPEGGGAGCDAVGDGLVDVVGAVFGVGDLGESSGGGEA
jgi:hypothetical protein